MGRGRREDEQEKSNKKREKKMPLQSNTRLRSRNITCRERTWGPVEYVKRAIEGALGGREGVEGGCYLITAPLVGVLRSWDRSLVDKRISFKLDC